GNASSTIPGEWLSATCPTCSRLNHARTFSMKIGNPLFSGKFDELRSKVSSTRRGLSETTIKGVSFEPATTEKFCKSIRVALSIDNSPSGTCCKIGWLADHNVIAGLRTIPRGAGSHETRGTPGKPKMRAGFDWAVCGAKRSKIKASMSGGSR